MRGKVAKQLRKILFAMQVKKQTPDGSEYRRNGKSGQIRVFGARSVYLGMKRAYLERGGFVAAPPKVVSKRAQAEHRREKIQASKRRGRARRRDRTAFSLKHYGEEPWQCPCGYMGLGPICYKCGREAAA